MGIKLEGLTSQYRGSNKNLVEQNFVIEWEKPVFKIVVFLSIFEDFIRSDNNKKVSLVLDDFKARELIEMLSEIASLSETVYFKLVCAKDKHLSLSRKEDLIYINFTHGKREISTPYSLIQIKAMVKNMESGLDMVLKEMIILSLDRQKKLVKK